MADGVDEELKREFYTLDISNVERKKLREETENLNDSQCKANFLFLHELGEGSYSTVYLCSHRLTSRKFAIKVCSKRQIIREKKVNIYF